jgi:membrane protease YdiL (CAAX protease family)
MPIWPMPAIPPRAPVWPAFVIVAAVLISIVAVWVVVVFIVLIRNPGIAANSDELQKHLFSASVLLPAIIAINVLELLLVGLFTSFSGETAGAALGLGRPNIGPVRLVLACIGTFCSGAILGDLAQLAGVPFGGSLGIIQDAIKSMGTGGLPAFLLVIALGPGIAEELTFRGFVQRRLLRRWGPRLSIVLSTLGFALVHLDMIQSLLVCGMGAYLGWITWRTGSTWAAIVCHIVNNVAAVFLMYHSSEEAVDKRLVAMWLLVFILVWLAVTWALHRTLPRRAADSQAEPAIILGTS